MRGTPFSLCTDPSLGRYPSLRDGEPFVLRHLRRTSALYADLSYHLISADFRGRAVREEKITADRLAAFSDAVFAVIVTIMVLELKAPEQPAFSALGPLWPTAISYVVSYLFIAIIWVNHHYLMRFAGSPTLGLIWINFVHLFMVSLLPFATAWIARTQLASSPMVFYAGLFVCIDIAYNIFEREVLSRAEVTQVSARRKRIARRRSLVVLVSFTTAMLVAFAAPRIGFGLICLALLLHLRPDVTSTRA